jgi:2-methylisocitrate lyase-like PEP mutase family enzyme
VTPAQQLRDLLSRANLEIMPGCYDALSAKLIVDAGYKVTFMSGFGVSAARLGLPDTGLISFSEMLDSLRNCCSAASKIPLIGDGDTGYGNALNVQRCRCRDDRRPGQPQEVRPHARQAGDCA